MSILGKSIHCIWCICFFYSNTFTQTAYKRTHIEPFDNNTNKWVIAKNDEVHSSIKNGKYTVESKSHQRTWFFSQAIPLLDQYDYTLTIHLNGVIYNKENYFGFFWGQRSTRTYQAVMFSSKGVRVETLIKGYELIQKSWEKLNKRLNDTKIIINRSSSKMIITVNNVPIYKGKPLTLFGNQSGILIKGKQKVSIDYIKFEQNFPIQRSSEFPNNLIKENIGPNINTKENELHPVIDGNTSTLFFTRAKQNKSLDKTKPNLNNNSIWIAQMDSDKQWQSSIKASTPLNNKGNNSVVSFSSDNSFIYLGNTYQSNGQPKGTGISKTRFNTSLNFDVPDNIHIEDFQNNGRISSYHVSPNGQVLFLTMDSQKNYRNSDLYVSLRINDSTFSKPKEITILNTPFDEGTPFLSSDYRTLYFSSNGHPGYGSFDIFYSKRIGNEWSSWSKPINVGPKINTIKWEGHYTESLDQRYRMFVSNAGMNHVGGDDIYCLIDPLNKDSISKSLMITDQNSKPINKAMVMIRESNGKIFDRSDITDGEIKMSLPFNEGLFLYLKKDGYFFHPLSVDTNLKKLHSLQITQLLDHTPITIPCNTKDSITRYSLTPWVKLLKDNADLHISVNGPSWETCSELKDFFIEQEIPHQLIHIVDTNATNCYVITRPDYRSLKETSIPLKKIKRLKNLSVDTKYLLEAFQYDADSFNLTRSMKKELDGLILLLNQNPQFRLVLIGHTNTLPPHPYCDNLSLKRVQEIRNYFQGKEMESNRYSTISLGKRYPLHKTKNQTKNQRVEIIFKQVADD